MPRLVMRVIVFSVGLLWTWAWLLPVGAFHHMVRCGILGWAVLDNENETFAVRWSVTALGLSVVVWLAGILVGRILLRAAQRRRPTT